MTEDIETLPPSSPQEQRVLWRKALIIGLTLLVWLTVSGMILLGTQQGRQCTHASAGLHAHCL